MHRNHSSSRRISGWFAAPLILIGVVVAFALYQQTQTPRSAPPPISATNTPVPATQIAGTPAPTKVFQPPTVLKLLSDKAGITAEVTEVYLASSDGWDLSHLDFYAGHLQGTPTLGQGGNFVLAGHVELKDGTPGPFAHLNVLTAGDTLLLLKLGAQAQVIRYIVTDESSVQPDDFDVIRNHGYEELTLITCGDWSPQDRTYHTRVVVHARPA